MLQACVASIHPGNPCVPALQHHFAAGGSRLRARICLEASSRLGLCEDDALCLSVVCELLHNASLVQDDLLDRAALRRGKPSLWAAYGDGTAVCSGDLMLASAYVVASEISVAARIRPALALIHQRTCEVIAGEAAEIAAAELGSVTAEQYESIAQGKSASLLSLALELPLCVAGYVDAGATAISVASSFAVAYQMADDLDDVAQDLLSHALNIVTIVRSEESITQAEAEVLVAARATALSIASIQLAETLPADCAAVLMEHAKALTERLTALRSTAVPATQQ